MGIGVGIGMGWKGDGRWMKLEIIIFVLCQPDVDLASRHHIESYLCSYSHTAWND